MSSGKIDLNRPESKQILNECVIESIISEFNIFNCCLEFINKFDKKVELKDLIRIDKRKGLVLHYLDTSIKVDSKPIIEKIIDQYGETSIVSELKVVKSIEVETKKFLFNFIRKGLTLLANLGEINSIITHRGIFDCTKVQVLASRKANKIKVIGFSEDIIFKVSGLLRDTETKKLRYSFNKPQYKIDKEESPLLSTLLVFKEKDEKEIGSIVDFEKLKKFLLDVVVTRLIDTAKLDYKRNIIKNNLSSF